MSAILSTPAPRLSILAADAATYQLPIEAFRSRALVESPEKAPKFVGSKGAAGIAEWIISLMPAHRCYIEPFLGKGAIFRKKLPAQCNIGVEADPRVVDDYWARDERWARNGAGTLCEVLTSHVLRLAEAENLTNALETRGTWIFEGDAIQFLSRLSFPRMKYPDVLIYADPPYLGSCRADRGRDYHVCEMKTEWEHLSLLELLQSLPCMVMISGYQNALYERILKPPKWRTSSKWTTTRGGRRVQEWLWMNFPVPTRFHDTRFQGTNYTDRQRIKRLVERWKKHFLAMPPGQRAAVFAELEAAMRDLEGA